jgi:hypothetical protein
MQKIRNRVSIAEKARVEKEKRQRKLRIDEARAREVYKDIKDEEDLLARYRGISDDYIIKVTCSIFFFEGIGGNRELCQDPPRLSD